MFSFVKKFLLQNNSLKQTVLKNTFWLTFAEIIARFSGLIIVIFIARVLGAFEYGKFTFALSFATIISIISDLGIVDISTRDLSRDRQNEGRIVDIFSLGLFLCVVALAVSALGSIFITQDNSIRVMIIILTLFVLTNSIFAIIFSFLRARQRMEYEAFVKILQTIFTAGIIFLVIFFFPGATNLSYGYFLANFLVLIPILIYFNKNAYKLSFKLKKDTFSILKTSWPLSFGFLIGWVYIYIDSVMLGYFNLISENGWYNAASKIALATIIPANLVIRSFYPMLSNLFVSSREKLQKAWDYLAEIMIILTIPTVVGGIVVSPKIISLFYGSDFKPSVLALQLLMVAIGFSFINYPYAIMLIVADRQKNNFWIMLFGSLLNIILNLIFIPFYGLYGCIIATIIASVVSFMVTVATTKYYALISPFDIRILKVLSFSFVSATLMFFLINIPAISRMNLFVVCFVGAIAYFVLMAFFYKVFFKNEKFFSINI